MTQACLLSFPTIDTAQGCRRNAAQTQSHVIQIQPGNPGEMHSMHAVSDEIQPGNAEEMHSMNVGPDGGNQTL